MSYEFDYAGVSKAIIANAADKKIPERMGLLNPNARDALYAGMADVVSTIPELSRNKQM